MKLGKIDLSQIECRLLNTLAGQWDIVEKFRDGKDLYSELASQFYGRPITKADPAERGTGKQLELSCGYGAGGATIVRTARAGTYGPAVYLTDEQGLQARDLYRDTHRFVTASWERANINLHALASGSDLQWGPTYIHDHRIFGPGGLWLDFTSLERCKFDKPKLHRAYEEWGWRHRVRNGWRKTYGARLVENWVQWLARTVISQAMVSIHRELGLRIPLTVHDDIIVVLPDGEEGEVLFDKAVKIVLRPLEWLPACPIAVEAKIGESLE